MIKIVKSTSNVKAYQWGPDAEVGINVRTMQIRFFPEVNERFQWGGNTIIRSVSSYFSREITCEGEITGLQQGVMAFTLGQACYFSNSFQHAFAPTGGTWILDDATISMARNGWRSVTIKASSNPFL